jgi:hypothetical protein
MAFSWVRPKQAPDDEIEVFGLGEPDAEDDTGDVLRTATSCSRSSRAAGRPRSTAPAI